MDTVGKILVVLSVCLSHILATLPFWTKLRRRIMPSVVDFAVISAAVFYDVGLAMEAMGFEYRSLYLPSFFNLAPETILYGTIIISITPWLFRIGSGFMNGDREASIEADPTSIAKPKRTAFYVLIGLASLYLAVLGYSLVSQDTPLWAIREAVRQDFGSSLIVLYLPLAFLAFYVRQTGSRTFGGVFFSLGLALCAILATLPTVQRSNTLFPILILFVFGSRQIRLSRLAAIGAITLIAASVILPLYKWQFSEGDGSRYSTGELVVQTVFGDYYRAGNLGATLEMAEPFGTKILPYPMSGYVYTTFLFVPREIAPFKGDSTTRYFTSYLTGLPLEKQNWGSAHGVIEEVLLNIGWILFIPLLIVYGMLLGLLDRASKHNSSLVVPTRLAALWVCGYQLSVILYIFGSMFVIDWVLYLLFVKEWKRAEVQAKRIDLRPNLS